MRKTIMALVASFAIVAPTGAFAQSSGTGGGGAGTGLGGAGGTGMNGMAGTTGASGNPTGTATGMSGSANQQLPNLQKNGSGNAQAPAAPAGASPQNGSTN